MDSSPERPIVVGVGPTAADSSLIAAAAVEAVARGAHLEVVHVVTSGTRVVAPLRRRIDAAVADVRAAHPGLDVSVTVVSGEPVTEILARPCDLLVVGHRRRTRRREGHASVALDVTDRATVPVLVWPVGAGPFPPTQGGRRGVLVAVGDRDDAAVLDFAVDEANARHLPVVAEHVWSGPEDGPAHGSPAGYAADRTVRPVTSEDGARALLRATVGTRCDRVPARRVVRRSLDVAIPLNAAARSADLTVVGAHRWRAGGGGVRRALIQRAACPVVVVPVPSTGQRPRGRPGARSAHDHDGAVRPV